MSIGMIGRKVGMMRLYDGAGQAHGVSVIELGPNTVTQLRTPERDGYTAVQVGFDGNRKRLTRPERGHLTKAGVDAALDELREFRTDSVDDYALGQQITVDLFQAGQFVNVAGTSKGRGFAGGVRRWNFHGGPKTHGQSDRHRAPGSVGAGTTPGRVFKGLHMAGHMGAETASVLNLLVVLSDPSRNLLFVEGSVPGPRGGIVVVEPGRRKAIADFPAPELPASGAAVEPTPEPTPEPEPEPAADAESEPVAVAESEPAVEAEAAAPADEQKSEAAE